MFSSSHIFLSMVIFLVHCGHSSNISYLLVHGDYLLSPCPWWLCPKSLSMVAIPMSAHQIYSILHRQLPKLVGQNSQNVLDPGHANITHDCSKVALLLLRNWCWSKMLMISSSKLAMLMLVSFTVQNLQCWCCFKDLSQLQICNTDAHLRWQAERTVLRTQLIDLQALDW